MFTTRALRCAAAAAIVVLPGCAVFGYPSPFTPPVHGSGEGGIGSGGASPGARSYEVNGRRYHVMASADGYREVGVASWYGPGFHNRPTSSGERFDQEAMTAAHRSLPLGTRVRVTNLENGTSVEVRINDRGPFRDVSRRIIDLSYGAARKLRIVAPGTARVEVRALDGD